MGRRPCCEKTGAGGGGVKKGPWTPEEDIILVSYIHQNGPGNWKSVPTNTGLSRCSKSCRLRWTNYLRPGIKRGSFTHHEEKLIFHLQALLGNRWAAIASYVPQRTDNDIKNYWNTHLKKKLLLRKQLAEEDDDQALVEPKGQWERRLQTDINMAKQALHDALYMDRPTFLYDLLPDHVASTYSTTTTSSSSTTTPAPSTYASSTENISRLLQNWTTTKPGPNKIVSPGPAATGATTATLAPNNINVSSPAETTGSLSFHCRESKQSAAEPLFPFSMLETWLFDDTSSFLQGGHDMIHADHMPPIF